MFRACQDGVMQGNLVNVTIWIESEDFQSALHPCYRSMAMTCKGYQWWLRTAVNLFYEQFTIGCLPRTYFVRLWHLPFRPGLLTGKQEQLKGYCLTCVVLYDPRFGWPDPSQRHKSVYQGLSPVYQYKWDDKYWSRVGALGVVSIDGIVNRRGQTCPLHVTIGEISGF